jgi:MoCo/4Fe-4S cofactor protein with predicted Tat translocation signal
MSLEQTPNQPEPLDIEKRGSSSTIDLKGVRARLQQQQQGSAQVWRSLDEVAETPEFKDYLHREFPSNASEWLDPVGRREIRELIAGLREKGVTVFMSTHILSDIEALCDEVAILRGIARAIEKGTRDATPQSSMKNPRE